VSQLLKSVFAHEPLPELYRQLRLGSMASVTAETRLGETVMP